MGKVRPGAASATCLIQALTMLMPFAAVGTATAENHCRTAVCPDEGVAAPETEPEVIDEPDPPPPLDVTLRHRSPTFDEGYNREDHAYEGWWLDSVLSPQGRLIQAFFCDYEPISIPQWTGDDFGECEDLHARQAPDGVRSIRWRLVDDGSGPLPPADVVEPQVHDLGPVRPVPGAECAPMPTPEPDPVVVPPDACVFDALAPLSSPTVIVPEEGHTYTALLEWLDAGGNVVRTGSRDIVIPNYAPLIVSLGDSFASGEGNPDRIGDAQDSGLGDEDSCSTRTSDMIIFDVEPDMHDEPYWFDLVHHRSLRSAPALAAQRLQEDYPYLAFLSLARSGAVIQDDEADEGSKLDLLEQLGTLRDLMEAYPDREIDVLLISIGGNDVGFSYLLEGLTGGSLNGTEAEEEFEVMLEGLQGVNPAGGGYPLLRWQIDEMGINARNIVLTEYPTSFFDQADGEPSEGCDVFQVSTFNEEFISITEGEARRMQEMAERLNEVIHATADQFDWSVVTGIAERFKTHGYCLGPGNSYFVRAQDSCEQQGDFMGTMHPNRQGTEAVAFEIEGTVRQLLPQPGQVVLDTNEDPVDPTNPPVAPADP